MRRLLLAVFTATALLGAAEAQAEVVWLCKPGQADNPCAGSMATTIQEPDGSERVETPAVPESPPVDCFYVYPTVSNQLTFNADKSKDPEVRAIAEYQAARFSLKCRVFAPVYRQLTLLSINAASPEQRAEGFRIAYGDVREAWNEYLERHNEGRGVVLIGHSQGTRMLRQLGHDEIDPRPEVRRRIVSGVLLGGNVLVRKGSDRGGDFQHLPACRADDQTGCVMAFSTFDYDPPEDSRYGRSPSTDPGTGLPWGPDYEVLCTNPASPAGNERRQLTSILRSEPFPPVIGVLLLLMYGGPPPSADTPWIQPGERYTGRCETRNGANVLFIEPVGDARRLRPVPDDNWGQHLADGNIALGDLVEVVGRQAAAYVAREAKPRVVARVARLRGCRVRVTVAGEQAGEVRRLDVRAGGRLVARDRRAPFAVRVRRARRLEIRAVLRDGRVAVLQRRLARRC